MSSADSDRDFDALLDFLRRQRGFDFSAYKRPGLLRRIQRRLQVLGIDGLNTYQDYLEVHPEEFGQLFNAILINVTSFFRDSTAWDYLNSDVIPQLLEARSAGEPIRVWSAGCASGEEAYSLAMLLAEHLGLEAYSQRVKIYATDADEDALTRARMASYTETEVAAVPPLLLARYFERLNDGYLVKKDLRRSIIFGRHDLIHDAPISRVDLLVCRYVLMYFNAETQSRILGRFHFALNREGYLFLGKAEMLLTHTNLFTPLDLERRIFLKVARVPLRDRLLVMSQTGSEEPSNPSDNFLRIREVAFDTDPLAQLVVDRAGTLVLASERARMWFRLSPKDLGRLFSDMEISFRPVELRSLIEQAIASRQAVALKDINWPTAAGEPRYLDLQVVPLLENDSAPLGVKITFTDVTRYKLLQQELETAYEELQTSNEELQSTVEELETTNEELQSTNEELETTNEELHSANEEMRTLNDELNERSTELNRLNTYLRSVLSSVRAGVAVLDHDLKVSLWSRQAEEMWGLRAEEVQDRNFLNLDMGLPVEQLKPLMKALQTGGSTYEELALEATNRRGRPIRCRVRGTPLGETPKDIQGIVLLMEEQPGTPPS